MCSKQGNMITGTHRSVRVYFQWKHNFGFADKTCQKQFRFITSEIASFRRKKELEK